ncbi:MAG: hypothetical protein ABI406_05990, partial [Ktedonobacteraceae bacterium]
MLADFGVASLISTETSHLTVPWAGSPAFMAPEVWNFCPGRYSDQYALAVMCFQLLTGKFPWQVNGQVSGRNWANIHRSIAPGLLHENRSDIPRAVDLVVQKALAKDPHERYSSVKEFAVDLREAMQDDTQEVVIPLPVLVRAAEQGKIVDNGNYRDYGQKQQGMRMTEVRLQHTARFVPVAEVHTEPVAFKRRERAKTYATSDNEWIWGALALNILVCLLLALQTWISTGQLTPAANLFLTLWPALLIGPIVASFFRALPLFSTAWGICLGLLFGVLDTLFSTIFCWAWTAIALTIPHWNRDWQYPGDGWHIFWGQVQWLQPTALSLLIGSVWLAVTGGMCIGYLNARRAVVSDPVGETAR